ncbi:MAG TPA: hypothetical protein PKC67_13855 [Kiritimatiellia bacterium]|nr:hypothetical protein [Kiritimatiellia bacterium]HMP35419.1 hypothetical protein [Kiritimatiellia bacterium]
MGQARSKQQKEDRGVVNQEFGSILTILSGLSFLVTCMILPLVGKAGAKVYHYPKNYTAFLVAVLVTIGLSGMATKLKLERSRLDGSPRPKFSMAILGVSLALLLALLTGLLKI